MVDIMAQGHETTQGTTLNDIGSRLGLSYQQVYAMREMFPEPIGVRQQGRGNGSAIYPTVALTRAMAIQAYKAAGRTMPEIQTQLRAVGEEVFDAGHAFGTPTQPVPTQVTPALPTVVNDTPQPVVIPEGTAPIAVDDLFDDTYEDTIAEVVANTDTTPVAVAIAAPTVVTDTLAPQIVTEQTPEEIIDNTEDEHGNTITAEEAPITEHVDEPADAPTQERYKLYRVTRRNTIPQLYASPQTTIAAFLVSADLPDAERIVNVELVDNVDVIR